MCSVIVVEDESEMFSRVCSVCEEIGSNPRFRFFLSPHPNPLPTGARKQDLVGSGKVDVASVRSCTENCRLKNCSDIAVLPAQSNRKPKRIDIN